MSTEKDTGIIDRQNRMTTGRECEAARSIQGLVTNTELFCWVEKDH